MREVLDLVDVCDGSQVSAGNLLGRELLVVAVQRGAAVHVVVDALVVDGRVEAKAHQGGAALLAGGADEARRAHDLAVVLQPLEGLGHMGARQGGDVCANGDDGLVALVEDLLEGHVEVVVEGCTAVAHVVDFARPAGNLLDGLPHQLDVFSRGGGDEEVVAALGRAGVGLELLAVEGVEVVHAPHGQLGHIPQAALEELRCLLGGEGAAALAGEAGLDQAGDGRLAENKDRVLLLHVSILSSS